MTIDQDRTTPRALSLAELQACWVPVLQDVNKERAMGSSLQSDSLLPTEAKHASSIARFEESSTYPSLRTSYDLCSTGALIERQTIRSFQLGVAREVITGASQDYYGDVKHKLFRKLFKEWMKEDQEVVPEFKDCYNKAADLKEEGNDLFRSNRWMDSLLVYAKSWGNLLPYHIHAFDKSDIQILAFGNIQNELFNNMMIALIKWSRNDPVLNQESKYALLGLALSCGQIATEPIQSATLTIGTMYKASYRICDIASSLQGTNHPLKGHNALKPKSLDHYRYFVKHLQDVPRDQHHELLQRWDPSSRERFVSMATKID